jgi:hypothetical protein
MQDLEVQRKLRVCITVSENEPNKPGLIKEDKATIFREMHENPKGSHLGMNRTYESIKLLVS